MEIRIPAGIRPVIAVEPVKTDAARGRLTCHERCCQQIIVSVMTLRGQNRPRPDMERDQAPPAQDDGDRARGRHPSPHAPFPQPVAAPGCHLREPDAGQNHDQQNRRINEAILLVGDYRVNGKDGDGGRERQRYPPGPECGQQQQCGGGAAPDCELASQIKMPGFDAK
jgi:hypothetical protein